MNIHDRLYFGTIMKAFGRWIIMLAGTAGMLLLFWEFVMERVFYFPNMTYWHMICVAAGLRAMYWLFQPVLGENE